jgi:hypothetical protein
MRCGDSRLPQGGVYSARIFNILVILLLLLILLLEAVGADAERRREQEQEQDGGWTDPLDPPTDELETPSADALPNAF